MACNCTGACRTSGKCGVWKQPADAGFFYAPYIPNVVTQDEHFGDADTAYNEAMKVINE